MCRVVDVWCLTACLDSSVVSPAVHPPSQSEGLVHWTDPGRAALPEWLSPTTRPQMTYREENGREGGGRVCLSLSLWHSKVIFCCAVHRERGRRVFTRACLPDIRVGGENAVFQRLRRHPADREQTFATFAIVIGLINVPGHAKICSEIKENMLQQNGEDDVQLEKRKV